jgi:hypothetical protein
MSTTATTTHRGTRTLDRLYAEQPSPVLERLEATLRAFEDGRGETSCARAAIGELRCCVDALRREVCAAVAPQIGEQRASEIDRLMFERRATNPSWFAPVPRPADWGPVWERFDALGCERLVVRLCILNNLIMVAERVLLGLPPRGGYESYRGC